MESLYRWTKEGAGEALRMLYKAIEFDPNFASAYGVAAWCYYWRFMENFAAIAHFYAGRYDEARQLAEKVCRKQPSFLGAHRVAAASNACVGHLEDARRFIARAAPGRPARIVSEEPESRRMGGGISELLITPAVRPFASARSRVAPFQS
jgi:tetratricopeptide (TPR) repeat protein